MGAHARLSPSAAVRWMFCPGSVRLTEHVEDEPSIYSAEGTALHQVRAECLELGLDVVDLVGQAIRADGFDFVITPDWVTWLQPGIDRLRELRGRLVVEHQVDLGRWMPEQFGTLDAGIVDDEVIVINDFKGGAGEKVDPEQNKQLSIYALGFWDNVARHDSKATKFRIEIDQPRAGGISTWETTLEELLAFGEEVREAALRTYDPDAPLHASKDACRWCPAKTTCAEHARFVLDLVGTKFDDLDTAALIGAEPVLPDSVTLERRSYIIEHASMFAGWLNALRAEALNDALAGRPVPGLKAVLGKAGPRKWRDDEQAAALLGKSLPKKEVFIQSVVSPTQAEKMLSTKQWDRIAPLITRSPASPILVPETDKREAIESVENKFDNLEDDLI